MQRENWCVPGSNDGDPYRSAHWSRQQSCTGTCSVEVLGCPVLRRMGVSSLGKSYLPLERKVLQSRTSQRPQGIDRHPRKWVGSWKGWRGLLSRQLHSSTRRSEQGSQSTGRRHDFVRLCQNGGGTTFRDSAYRMGIAVVCLFYVP